MNFLVLYIADNRMCGHFRAGVAGRDLNFGIKLHIITCVFLRGQRISKDFFM